jgi:hypothetical protein
MTETDDNTFLVLLVFPLFFYELILKTMVLLIARCLGWNYEEEIYQKLGWKRLD